jgi:hypothetical protein
VHRKERTKENLISWENYLTFAPLHLAFGSGSPIGYGLHEDINYPLVPIFDMLFTTFIIYHNA